MDTDEMTPCGALDWFPRAGRPPIIRATCNICKRRWRRYTAKGAHRTLRRHWLTGRPMDIHS